jgi:hypothetical protein
MRYPGSGISRQMSAVRVLAMLVLTMLVCGPTWADTPAASSGGESAVWTEKQVRFVYLGFTTKFSCDGLADRVKQVLLLLGARKDLQVSPVPCSTPFGRPDPFPGVTVKMNVLEPAGTKSGGAAAQTVRAHWKMVDVNQALAKDPLWQAGQCELLEQIKQTFLPQFTTRNVQYRSTCVPFQLYLGATQLRAEVLIADEQDAQAPAAAPAAH